MSEDSLDDFFNALKTGKARIRTRGFSLEKQRTTMKFSETHPAAPWYEDVEVPNSSQAMDLDWITNYLMARVTNGGKTPMTIGWAGNYKEGVKLQDFVREFMKVLPPKTAIGCEK
jgi:hypothetical protein